MDNKRLIIIVAVTFLLIGVFEISKENKTSIENESLKESIVLKENKIDLDLLWAQQMKFKQSDYYIAGDTVYIFTYNGYLYQFDIDTGEILMEIKLGEVDGMTEGIAVDDHYIAISFANKIEIYDIENQKLVYSYVSTKLPVVHFKYRIMLREGVLVFSNLHTKKIHGIDYINGNELWTIANKDAIDEVFNLLDYKDKNLYNRVSDRMTVSFDIHNGKTLEEYPFNKDIRFENNYRDNYLPLYNISDSKLKNYLNDYIMSFFVINSENLFFAKYDDLIIAHSNDGKEIWNKKMESKIRLLYTYRKYIIFEMADYMVVFDPDIKEIIWKLEFDLASKPRYFIHDDKLFLPSDKGELRVYDLSKLKS